jgi:hypothetical protein
MAQRISRAKQTIKATGINFALPPEGDRAERLRAVRHVVYLVFNEGYTATTGARLQQVELAEEAIRITRMLHRLMPADGGTSGLLALMVLTHARRAARVGLDGALIPLADQDRSQWDRRAIEEGVALVERALATAAIGPYQLQAAIAALHAEAPSAEDTDWHQIASLYTLLERIAPNPVFALNRTVAVAMAKVRRSAWWRSQGLRLTSAWPAITAWRPCEGTCWSSPATKPAPRLRIGLRHSGPRAGPNGDTSSPALQRWQRAARTNRAHETCRRRSSCVARAEVMGCDPTSEPDGRDAVVEPEDAEAGQGICVIEPAGVSGWLPSSWVSGAVTEYHTFRSWSWPP